MANKELHELTSGTPTLTDITVFGGPSGGAEVKKSTFQSIIDLAKTYFDTLYQVVLQSGVNIRTINGNTLLGSTDLTIPALTDGDKGDITVSSSGTVWTIDNSVVTNAKLANVATGTFKGRNTLGTGAVEDLTPTQATSLLNQATTSLKGLMSPTDKTKLDSAGYKLYMSASQATRSGAGEVTMYSFTLPANTLGTTGYIEGTIYISDLTTTGSGSDMSITAKYGSTLIGNLTVVTNNTNEGKGELKFILASTGSTSSQKITMYCQLGGSVGGGSYTSQSYIATGTTTFDSTTSQTININTFPSAVGQSCTMEGISVVAYN